MVAGALQPGAWVDRGPERSHGADHERGWLGLAAARPRGILDDRRQRHRDA